MDEPIWTLPPNLRYPAVKAYDMSANLPWHIRDYDINTLVWPKSKGKGIIAGIVDTGVSKFHAEQGGLRGKVIEAADFTGSRFGWEDGDGHGTHVACIEGDIEFGMAPEGGTLIAKALGDDGVGQDKWIARALQWLALKGATVINMSLGSETKSKLIEAVINELAQQCVIVFAASGNSSVPGRPAREDFPGQLPNVVCVSAIDQEERVAPFASVGPAVDVAAPGVMIPSRGRGNTIVSMSGTSQATPWTCGAVHARQSWLKANNLPQMKTVDEAIDWLATASIDLGTPGKDFNYGVGLPTGAKFFAPVIPPPVIDPPPVVGRTKVKQVIVTLNDGTIQQFE